MSAVDEIQSKIARARRFRYQSEDVEHLLRALVPWAVGLRAVLLDYFEHQRDYLFPRVRRVFGTDMEEIFLLGKYHKLIIDALDEFLDELPDPEVHDSSVL